MRTRSSKQQTGTCSTPNSEYSSSREGLTTPSRHALVVTEAAAGQVQDQEEQKEGDQNDAAKRVFVDFEGAMTATPRGLSARA